MATGQQTNKHKKLLDLHEILIKSIAATEKDIHQCSLEWLQLCDLSKKVENSGKGCAVTKEEEIPSTSVAIVEDTTIINTQPIDLNISIVKEDIPADEEFDSD